MGDCDKVVRMALSCALLLAIHCGDVLAAKPAKKDKSDVERRSFQNLKPAIVLQTLEEYPAVREFGKVRIELTQVPSELRSMFFVNIQPRETTMGAFTGINSVGTALPVWMGVLPFYEVNPKNLQFNVRVTNHLGRVLRLQGVALQFTKDGETVPTDYTENDLNKVVILPEKSWEGVLHGPVLDAFGLKAYDARTAQSGLMKAEAVASEGVLMVGLYDVITEMDEASSPTKRSNFEWVFGYSAKSVPEAAEALRWKAKLTAEQVQQLAGDQPAEKIAPLLPGDFVAGP